ncbi:lipopolysaccharide biosynthesis protein [Weissella soli]|uniref:lipopolysaccharide biosynthesis protein n=1 Tax=Weissella soli TaxID=155866 RepID=UPI001F33EAFD|nr:oligosaccharide flippase family protein [Weissella soli]
MDNKQQKIGALLAYLNVFVKNGVLLIYTPFLIHLVGNVSYGTYQLTTQIVNTLSILALGFSGAYVKFYWEYKSKSDTEVNLLNGIYIIFFSFVAVMSLIIGSLFIFNAKVFFSRTFNDGQLHVLTFLMAIMVVNIALTFISTVFDSFITANQKFVFQQSRILLSTLLQPLLSIPMLLLGAGIKSVVIVQTLITVLFLVLNVRYAVSKLRMRFSFSKKQKSMLKAIMAFSGFIIINDVVDVINNNFPGMIVGSILGPVSVAIYSVAIQIRTIFFQLSISISSVFSPQINKMVSNGVDDESLSKLMTDVGRIQFTVLSFVLGGFVVGGQYFIRLWAGSEFSLSYWMVLLMVFPVLVPLSQNVGIEIQRAKNLHHFRSWVLALFAFINILLTIILAKSIGVLGAVIGYVISILLGNGLMINLYNHKVVGLNMIYFWKAVLPLFVPFSLATMISLMIKHFVELNSFVVFVISLGLYVGIYIIIWSGMKSNRNELDFIKRTLKIKRVK